MNNSRNDNDIEIHANAALAIAIYRRLARILDAHCSGYIIIHNDALNWGYIKLRNAFQELLSDTSPLASIAESDYADVLPPSLSDLGDVEADMIWDAGLGTAVRRLEGELLVACANSGIDPFNQGADEVLDHLGYDAAIDEFVHMKEVETRRFLSRYGIASPANTTESSSDQPDADQKEPNLPDGLTENDLKILNLWRQGVSAAEIGEQVFRSPKTIQNIVTRLRSKYGDDVVPRRRQG